MGIDFGNIFGNVTDAVDQAVTDAKETGLPMLQASLEKWGIDVLTKQHEQTQATVNENVKEILGRPSDPNGMGAYIANTLREPMVQQYGGLILGGIVAVGIVALVVFRKG